MLVICNLEVTTKMKKVFIAAVIIFLIFIIVLQFIPLGIEPLTELYFENHTSLRANSFPNTDYNFTFTINNLEYQKMAYNYTINILDTNNLIKKIDSGRISLENNMSTSISSSYNINKGFERAQIKIIIEKDDLGIIPDFKKKLWWPDPNYPKTIDIHFWTDEVTGPTITITH
jgi:hypothetical protein